MALRAEYGFPEGTGASSASNIPDRLPMTVDGAWTSGHTGHGIRNTTAGESGAFVEGQSWPFPSSIATWTMMAWFKVGELPDGQWLEILGATSTANEYVFLEYARSGATFSLAASVQAPGGAWQINGGASPLAFNPMEWHHFAMVRDGLTMRVYVDGALLIEATNASATGNNNMHDWLPYFAYSSGADRWGVVDDVRLFDAAESAASIAAFMAAPVGTVTPKRVVLTSSGTYTPSPGVETVDVVVIGGGGGGGRAGSSGAGGGAGQVRVLYAVPVSGPVAVTVGAGGAGASGATGAGADGSTSAFGAELATGGGGGGGGGSAPGRAGASGGGGHAANTGSNAGGAGTAGHAGGAGAGDVANAGTITRAGSGGGGGAGAVGGTATYSGGATGGTVVAGAGGAGVNLSALVGVDVGAGGWFGAGGGGGTQHSTGVAATAGAGGAGGGGAGRTGDSTLAGVPGLANTGSGGGGGAGSAPTAPATDGGNGAAGVVIVLEGSVFPGGEIPGTSTASLTNPTARWAKGTTHPLWFDGQEWQVALPTPTGHQRRALDALPATGPLLSSSQSSRVTTFSANGQTGVLVQGTASGAFTLLDAASAPLLTGTVPFAIPDHDASPVALHRATDGALWAAAVYGSAVRVTRSTDNGATWGAAQTIATFTTATGLVALESVGSTVVLLATGNDGGGRAARTISDGAASYASGAWTTEALPALPAGTTSDDHLAVTTTLDGRLLAVSKTTNDGLNLLLLYLLVRSTAGVWTVVPIEVGPDDDEGGAVGYSRPVIATQSGAVVVMYGSIYAPRDLSYRTALVSDLTAWSPRVSLLTGGDYSDSAVLPRAEHLEAAGGDLPLFVHNRATARIEAYTFDLAALAPDVGPEGTFSGTHTWTGGFTGSRPSSGAFAGSHAWEGAFSGSASRAGTFSGSHAWDGSFTGAVEHVGTFAGSHQWAGAFAGESSRAGTFAGSHVWAGAFEGEAPGIPSAEGSFAGSHTWDAVFVGEAPLVPGAGGVFSGSHAWTGAFEGSAEPLGVFSGSHAWTGAFEGQAPDLDTAEGTFSGGHVWSGGFVGEADRSGTFAGTHVWVGVFVGSGPGTAPLPPELDLVAVPDGRTLLVQDAPPLALAATVARVLTLTATTDGETVTSMLTVKRGDRFPTEWTVADLDGVPVDLAGATVRLLARLDEPCNSPALVVLAATVKDPARGLVEHVLTGQLAAGSYNVEAEVTRDGNGEPEIRTAPTRGWARLEVLADLG